MPSVRPDWPGIQTAALLGSYVPRKCGIATFTKDLHDALAADHGPGQITILAMDDVAGGYAYPEEVHFQIPTHDLALYRTAAELLNINQIDVALVQHEYGIYGGSDGSHVLELMRRLRMPTVTTLHTVLREPTPGQRAVMDDIARISDRLVVMSHLAEDILLDVYGVSPDKVAFIPHGIPDLPFVDPSFYKDKFGVEGRTVLLTFGLLSPGKGIEVVIRALPRIIERHPEVVYMVVGATHPHLLRREGTAYRDSLERLVIQLKIREHVVFHDRFVTLEELRGYLGMADVYIAPYLSESQITSGTLAYAMGAGKPVVSTPFWYAEEMLDGGRGRLVPFDDSRKLADTVIDLLDNDVERDAMRKNAYMHCRPMVWKEVGRRYLEVASEAVRNRTLRPRPVFYFRWHADDTRALPEVDLTHLRRLTDQTGILQHAIYNIPNRHYGYSTDDNSRALIATLMYQDLIRGKSAIELGDIYLSFLHYAFDPRTKRFRNFMSFDRRWLEESVSQDVHGRSIWALGLATALAPNDAMLSFAARLFQEALEEVRNLAAPRSWAFSLVGMHAYLERFEGDTYVRRRRLFLARKLHGLFMANATEEWPWCEEVVTYDNAKLPHALILSGQWIPDPAMVEQGLRTLEWLVDLQTTEEGTVSLIGNDGWIDRSGRRARFDQQPVEAMALIEACAEAYRCTRDQVWVDRAHRMLGWFLGNNDNESILYDYRTGGCRDGLHADGPNLNQGAESTLAWLVSLLTVMWLDRERSEPEGEGPKKVASQPAMQRDSAAGQPISIPPLRQDGAPADY